MITMILIWMLLAIVICYWHARAWLWILASFIALWLGFFMGMSGVSFILLLLLLIVMANLILVAHIRRQWLSKFMRNMLKGSMPPISETERTALETGHSWIEESVLQGNIDFKAIAELNIKSLTEEENKFIDNEVRHFLSLFDDWAVNQYDKDLPKSAWDFLKKHRFFGITMDSEYGGLGFSHRAHSEIINHIAQRSLTAAVTVMVPNSLGPAELIDHYGTAAQKKKYLPRLAKGQDIPCFGLTSTQAGSDATTMTDFGVVCHQIVGSKKVLGIRLNFAKRYITLAPVATLIGLAFKLYDPDHILGPDEDLGITICLVPRKTPGLKIGQRHLPMNIPFMNGPVEGQDVFVPMTSVIGDQEMIGQGWRMLMECLSTGRAISLPALSSACGRLSVLSTGAYARVREQFGLPIGQFEGIQQKLAEMVGLSYIIDATALLTLTALEQGKKPSVASAIAKYHTTEMARKIINHGMDIHGGKSIIMGPLNYLANAYQGIPISITVEGANIMTRNLIIFGQGIIKCHPYLLREIESLNSPDDYRALVEFDLLLMSHLSYFARNKVRAIVYGLSGGLLAPGASGPYKRYIKRINRLSTVLSFASDMALLILRGSLKRKESMSARLGDMMSYLYMATAIIKFSQGRGHLGEEHVVEWSLTYLIEQAQQAFFDFCDNLKPWWVGRLLRYSCFPFGRSYTRPCDALSIEVSQLVTESSQYRQSLKLQSIMGLTETLGCDLVEDAFLALIESVAIYDKVKTAVKKDQISRKLPISAQLEQAKKQKIITAKEFKQVMTCEQKRASAIAVDSFNKI